MDWIAIGSCVTASLGLAAFVVWRQSRIIEAKDKAYAALAGKLAGLAERGTLIVAERLTDGTAAPRSVIAPSIAPGAAPRPRAEDLAPPPGRMNADEEVLGEPR